MNDYREEEDYEEKVSSLFKALGNPNRLRILNGLYEGRELADISKGMNITRGGVQKHLDPLLETGLIRKSKRGKYEPSEFCEKLLDKLYSTSIFDKVYKSQDIMSEVLEEVNRREKEFKEKVAGTDWIKDLETDPSDLISGDKRKLIGKIAEERGLDDLFEKT